MKAAIRQHALELGFDDCRFTTADPPTHAGQFLKWLEAKRRNPRFSAHLIGVSDLRSWQIEAESGNIHHQSGAFFSIEGVRVTSTGLREVNNWDQPIFTQREGGILALIAKREGCKILFLLHAKAEPGAEVLMTRQDDGSVTVNFSDGSDELHVSRREFMRNSGVAAAAAAVFVATKAEVALPPEVSALPALNPNQPTHKRQAPATVKGTLWGGMGLVPYPWRLPTKIQATRPAIPALM